MDSGLKPREVVDISSESLALRSASTRPQKDDSTALCCKVKGCLSQYRKQPRLKMTDYLATITQCRVKGMIWKLNSWKCRHRRQISSKCAGKHSKRRAFLLNRVDEAMLRILKYGVLKAWQPLSGVPATSHFLTVHRGM